MAIRTTLLTCLSMLAFAGNSILCRLALMERHIDPLSFTTLRLASGALILYALVCFSSRRASATPVAQAATSARQSGSWLGAIALVLYALSFSLAYTNMESGVGALILFGSVQLSMLLYGMIKGERPTALSMVGLLISITGLVLLLLPGSSAPPLGAAGLMAIAGAAWGWYSIRGKGAANPLASTASNFARAVPFSLMALVPLLATLHWDARGLTYAILSGTVTSGLGYVIWYGVMKQLTVLKASTVQLSVPILTAIMGTALLGEVLTLQLMVSCILVLGGIGMVMVSKGRQQTH
ncbi:DMT family transporter [Pusillimonas harenae]|uniref:DMT family transporter n=1 Tax=Pollutimonas harenae TaxID=657015 RepID=A0A853GQL3_9BURK|nr:DMT family transporter [Pollutimonas harenae]